MGLVESRNDGGFKPFGFRGLKPLFRRTKPNSAMGWAPARLEGSAAASKAPWSCFRMLLVALCLEKVLLSQLIQLLHRRPKQGFPSVVRAVKS